MIELENRKKMILVFCCLGLACAIMGYQLFGSNSRGGAPKSVWMKCMNSQCKAEFQMPAKDWVDFLLKDLTSSGGIKTVRQIDPKKAFECSECHDTTALQAIKCEDCGLVFIQGSAKGKSFDTCPQCGYDRLAEK